MCKTCFNCIYCTDPNHDDLDGATYCSLSHKIISDGNGYGDMEICSEFHKTSERNTKEKEEKLPF